MQHLPHLLKLTHAKDRSTTDMALVQVLAEVINPVKARLCEIVQEQGIDRCITLAEVAGSAENGVSENTEPLLLSSDQGLLTAVQTGDSVLDVSAGLHRLVVPLTAEMGQVFLLVLEAALPWTDAQRLVVEGFGMVYRNFVNLIDHGERDSLTGLHNRKSFDETFYKATRVQAAAPLADPLQRRQPGGAVPCHWLAVIDIDHFKQVNDRFGHLIGDEVLLLLARVMRNSFRYGDRLYRFGGEEFVVLLRADSEAEASTVFERLREKIADYPFPQVQRVTVSIGYTRVRTHDTPTAAFDRADRVLYQAKTTGRNRVCCFETQLNQGHVQEANNNGDVELF
jgi:diguanylate cyclase (GGDEF)-like protein